MVRPFDGDFHDDVDDGWDEAERLAYESSDTESFDTYIPPGEELSQERCEMLAERQYDA
jgi:hypothetical protein